MNFRLLHLLFLSWFILACKQEKTPSSTPTNTNSVLKLGKLSVFQSKSTVYIHSGTQVTEIPRSKLPIQSVCVMKSSAIGFLSAIDALDVVKGVADNGKYIYDAKVKEGIEKRTIENIGNANEVNLENVLRIQPDLFISTPNPLLEKFYKQIRASGIPVLLLEEFTEAHPLKQAEYIKLFGILTGKEAQANELFKEVSINYNSIKSQVSSQNRAPKILVGVMYGDVWYRPDPSSLTQVYFNDLGAADVLAKFGNRLGFESVVLNAQEAEYWLNAADFSSLEQLQSSYKGYDLLPVVDSGSIYNWSARRSPTAANDYFESGVVRPDWVLKDLAKILYPKLFPMHNLFFYRKLD